MEIISLTHFIKKDKKGNEAIFYENIKICNIVQELNFSQKRPMNTTIASQNLKDLAEVFLEKNIPCFLMFGTLLGAIRDKKFISHDKDTDVATSIGWSGIFISQALPRLLEVGFRLGRLNSDYASLVRQGEYIDIYFFTDDLKDRDWLINSGIKLKKSWLYPLERTNFYDFKISIPNKPEAVLKHLYGRRWRIPISGYPALAEDAKIKRIKRFLRSLVPYRMVKILQIRHLFYRRLRLLRKTGQGAKR